MLTKQLYLIRGPDALLTFEKSRLRPEIPVSESTERTRAPRPVLEAAIRQLCDRSMSLDIYVWLVWRLHRLSKATSISLPALHAQFGTGYKAALQFKPRFTEALEAALAAYSELVWTWRQSDHPEPGPAADCPDRLTTVVT